MTAAVATNFPVSGIPQYISIELQHAPIADCTLRQPEEDHLWNERKLLKLMGKLQLYGHEGGL
jgi:hypothetical protein